MSKLKQLFLSVMLFWFCIILIGCEKEPAAKVDTLNETDFSNESDTLNDADFSKESDTSPNSDISNDLDISNINSDLILCLKESTGIPVYLPAAWNPIQKETGQTYYLQTTGDEESYGINVYRTNEAVKFNDSEDLLEKNGPVSEADFIGSIEGELYNPDSFTYDVPEDTETFELAPDITAYKAKDGTAVWWENNGWKFSFVGDSAFTDTLKDLALAWSQSNMNFSKTGYVNIVGGNRLTFYFKWEKEGYQYNYTSGDKDFNEVINILNSFTTVNFG